MTMWNDFCTFAQAQLSSGDIDPMYPVLRQVVSGLDPDLKVWYVLLYLTWYHAGTAERVWTMNPKPRYLVDAHVRGHPTGIERRGFRGNLNAALFINGCLERANEQHGSLYEWAMAPEGTPEERWAATRAELQKVPYGGPWASYKWADLLTHVLDAPMTANDIGVGGNSPTAGPIPGMVALTGRSWKECATNVKLQNELLWKAREAGVPFQGLDQLETALCDFNSLLKGRYYVGHDIDDQMTKLYGCSPSWWAARAVFPAQYRGEVCGWNGVRSYLKKLYAKEGKLLV